MLWGAPSAKTKEHTEYTTDTSHNEEPGDDLLRGLETGPSHLGLRTKGP